VAKTVTVNSQENHGWHDDIYLAWEKPEEHIAIACLIDSKKPRIAHHRSTIQTANCCELSSYTDEHKTCFIHFSTSLQHNMLMIQRASTSSR